MLVLKLSYTTSPGDVGKMSAHGSDRPIDELLRERLLTAQARYRRATDEYKRLRAVASDVERINPDGRLALRQAQAQHQLELHNYMRTLRQFTDYTVYKKPPEDL